MPDMSTTRKGLTDLLEPGFLARLDALDWISRRVLRGKLQGERRSKARGQGVEFADHRPYAAGDDLRFVDWNIYARLNQLVLKLFLEEQDLTVHIAVDLSGSMATGDPAKGLYVKRLAAALGYLSLVHNNRVTLSGFAEGLQGQLGPVRGRAYLASMAEFLLARPEEGQSRFDTSCRQLAASRTGSGVMVVLSDFFIKEGFETGLKRLISPHYDLYVIQVLSPQELSPTLSGDLRLVDVEDADAAEVTCTATLLKYYQRTLAAYCNQVKDFCLRHGAIYALADSSSSVEHLVLDTLRRMRLLK
jgi:uncharacterized protein (DUF58 family)